MPRLRSTASGVVVNVSAEAAANMGSEWEPAGKSSTKAPAEKAPAAKAAPTKSK